MLTKFKKYRQQFWHETYLMVGIVFSYAEWQNKDTAYYCTLIEELEKIGLNVIALFTPCACKWHFCIEKQ